MNNNTKFWIFTILTALTVGFFTNRYLQNKKRKEQSTEQPSRKKFQELMLDVVREKELKNIFHKLPEENQRKIDSIAQMACTCTDSLECSSKLIINDFKYISRQLDTSSSLESGLQGIAKIKSATQPLNKFLKCAGAGEEIGTVEDWEAAAPEYDKKKRFVLVLELLAYRIRCSPAKEVYKSLFDVLSSLMNFMNRVETKNYQ